MSSRRPEPRRVVVIGAGAVGAACASALARAGAAVTVLSDPKRSTTAVSGGHLLLQSRLPGPSLDLARRSLELLTAWVEGRDGELQYRRHGSLVAAANDAEAAALRTQFGALKGAGVPLEWLDGDQARALEPALSPNVVAASYGPRDAQVHPGALAASWLQDALAHRAVVRSGAVVEGFIRSGGAVAGVVAGRAEFLADAVVIAAGPWSGELAAMAGVELPVRPRRGILLRGHSERVLASRPLLGACYLLAKLKEVAPGPAFSFQQHPDGECVLGGTREFVGFSDEGLAAAAPAILAEGARYLPAVGEMEWPRVEAGFRPWTPEGRPLIGRSAVPGLYLACGHEGDGITLAAATGELIAAAVMAP